MARYYGVVQGSGSCASRLGTVTSGMEAHIRGWDIGARVILYVDKAGEDCCRVEITGGSKNPGCIKSLGVFKPSMIKRIEEEKNEKTRTGEAEKSKKA